MRYAHYIAAIAVLLVTQTGCLFVFSGETGANGETEVEDNRPPNASIKVLRPDPDVGDEVTLDAENSSDPNGDPLTYYFRVKDPDGQVIHEYEGREQSTKFQILRSGRHEVALTVIDEHGETDTVRSYIDP